MYSQASWPVLNKKMVEKSPMEIPYNTPHRSFVKWYILLETVYPVPQWLLSTMPTLKNCFLVSDLLCHLGVMYVVNIEQA